MGDKLIFQYKENEYNLGERGFIQRTKGEELRWVEGNGKKIIYEDGELRIELGIKLVNCNLSEISGRVYLNGYDVEGFGRRLEKKNKKSSFKGLLKIVAGIFTPRQILLREKN